MSMVEGMRMMRAGNVIFLLLSAAIIQLLVLPGPTSLGDPIPEHSFGGGSGTKEDPYVIEDVWDLQNMSKDLTAHYVLGNDINASDTVNWNSGRGFVPIGTNIHRFTGGLDGKNYRIHGLFINLSEKEYIGLFGYIRNWGSVKNVGLINVSIIGKNYVGGLVGYNSADVSNCFVEGNITGDWIVGGLVGYNTWYGVVENCHTIGNIVGDSCIGGLVGVNTGDGRVINCYVICNVNGTSALSGIVGINSASVSNSHYNIDRLLINGYKHVTYGALFEHQYEDWKSNNLTLDINDYRDSLITSGSYYNIDTVQGIIDLLGFTEVKNYRFRLISDIDMSENPGLWIPYFGASEFDGNNHIISNLKINNEFSLYTGLFGYNKGGSIKNIKLLETNIIGYYYTGGLTGYNDGIINNCVINGNIQGNTYVGGIAGYNTDLISLCNYTGNISGYEHVGGILGRGKNLKNCISEGNVIGSYYIGGLIGSGEIIQLSHTSSNVSGVESVGGVMGLGTDIYNSYGKGNVSGVRDIGGLVGRNYDGMINDCSFNGVIKGNINVGGILGYTSDCTISNCYFEGIVISDGVNIGGFVGRNHYSVIYKCHSKHDIIGMGTNVGGFVGENQHTISRSYSLGNVSGKEWTGGFVGSYSGTITNSYYNIDESMINDNKDVTFFGLYQDQFSKWLENKNSLDIVDYNKTLAPADEYYQIASLEGMKHLLGFIYISNYKFKLVSDIDLINLSGYSIPCFSAHEFNGNNKTLLNINLNISNKYVGLFGFNEGGTIKNLTLLNISISGSDQVGGIVGYNTGRVLMCDVKGNVSGRYYVGGVVGVNSGYVFRSSFIGDIEGDQFVGGAVGINNVLLNHSYANGNVKGNLFIGGLAGLNTGNIINSYYCGNVIGVVNVGGLLGINYGTVNTSFVQVSINATENVGGLVGNNSIGIINNSYANGDVHGYLKIGGLVGENNDLIKNSYSNTLVEGSMMVGALIGMNKRIVENSFWNKETSGQNSSDGGTCKTIIEMKSRRTYIDAGWDFEKVWVILENMTYPILRWQDTANPTAHAGYNLIIDEGTAVMLDGSLSSDDFGIANYTWMIFDKEDIVLYGVKEEYVFNNPGLYTVTLNVTDPAGKWDSDTMIVIVNDITPPAALSGPDHMINEGEKVIFDGSRSFDNVGIANYTWTFYDKGQVTLYGVRQEYRFDSPGNYEVTLKVSDTSGNYDTDNLEVRVLDLFPPIADAGPDQTVAGGNIVTFDGSKSYDTGGIAYYTWIFIYNDEQIFMNGPHPHFLFDIPGTYSVTLTVMDPAGRWDSDRMKVKVLDITQPLAEAGSDRIVDEDTTLTFDGRRSHDNVGIASYTWTFFDGIEDVVLQGSTPSHIFTVPGRYTITLTVMDEAGNSGSDTMTVSVRDITPPIANAGEDLVVDEGSPVQFDASGSSDNVMIVNYTWTVISGSRRTSLYGVDPVHVFGDPGVYVVTLEVLDGAGLTDSHAIMVTVLDTTPPASVAGPDRIVDVGTLVIFDGSGSSDNVGIVNYTWTFNDGSANVILYGIHPSHTFSISGTYTVTLTVRDEAGNEGIDSFSVDVLAEEKADDHLSAQITALVILVPLFVLVLYLLVRSRRRREPEE